MKRRHLPALRAGHQVQLLQGGEALFAELVHAIDASRHEVRLETYIFHFDAAGARVAEALMRAARRGVQVFLVMDGVGTPQVPAVWAERLDAVGVQWRVFLPLGRVGLLLPSHWRRLHRKLCVVDGHVAFCGGINVLDDWHDPNHGPLQSPRFDFAVRVSGPLVRVVHETMASFWWRQEAVHDARQADFAAIWQDLQAAVASSPLPRTETRHAAHGHGARAALLLRDNLRHRSVIERAYRKAIAEAQHEILIANAYFLPGRKLREALIHAARRGVRVRLLLQGRYEYFMQYHAVRTVYGALLAAGIEIHEYRPSFLHAKVAVIDRRWATVGSSNLDPLSLLLAREANVVVDDAVFARALRSSLLQAMEQDGHRVEAQAYATRSWRQRLLDRLAFSLMRLAVFLSGKRY